MARPWAPALFLALLGLGPVACRSAHRQSLPPPPAAEARPTLTAADPAATSTAGRISTTQQSSLPTTAAPAAPVAALPTAQASQAPARPDAPNRAPAGALGLGEGTKGGRLGRVYRLEGLRQGEHPGFTRLVWQLATDSPGEDAEGPLWEIVEEVNQAEPKAAALLKGCCHLRLRLADTYAQDFVGALSLDPAPGGPVLGTRLLPMEDDSSLTFAVDLAEPAPYTVTVLQGPLRVVVDLYRP